MATGQMVGVDRSFDLTGRTALAQDTTQSRTMAARFSDEISILDFGASPSKTAAQNTAAINAAIVEAGSTKRVVGVPGAFAVECGIEFQSGTHFDGRGMTFVPSATPDTHLIRGEGTSGVHFTDIVCGNFTVDGTNKPADPDYLGGWAQVRFDYTDGLMVHNIIWDNVHSCLVMSRVTDFNVSNLSGHTLTDGVVTMFTGCARGVITNIQATDASECMDFFNAEDVVVDGVQATGAFTASHLNETFDISTSRRISINNVVSRGFSRGALVKSEGTGDGVQVAWSDISLTDCQFFDFKTYGVNVQSSGAAYNGGTHRVRLVNVTCKSSEAGAIGMAVTPDSTYGGNDCRVEGCTIDVPGTGIESGRWTNLVIKGNKVLTASGRAIDVTSVSAHGARIEGNTCYASGGTSSDGCIFVQRSDDVRILDNVVYSAAGYGIRFTTGTAGGKRPLISRNRIDGAGLYGIYVQWASATQFDALRAGEISLNDVRDWGLTTSSRAAIFVTFSNITATVEGLVISNNTMTLPSAAANSQSGINVIQASGAVTFSRCKIDNNVVGSTVPSTVYTLQGTWTQLNSFSRNLPALADLSQVSADRGDNSVTLTARVDEQVQLFATTLTGNKTVSLSTTGAVKGDWFRIVRSGLGAFTLAVGSGPLKTMPSATAAWCEVHYNGSAWILSAYGTL